MMIGYSSWNASKCRKRNINNELCRALMYVYVYVYVYAYVIVISTI
jgi:hypothetical protein